jgi:hypothetical protein
MKKIAWLLLVITVVFISCDKNDDDDNMKKDPPTLSLLTTAPYVFTDSSFKAGDEMKFYFIAQKGSENITNFRVEMKTDITQTVFDTGLNAASLQFEKTFTKGFAEKEEWTFIVRDKNLKERSVTLIISLDTGAVFEEVLTFEDVVMGAQNHPTAPKSFFSFAKDSSFTLEEAFYRQKDIDLVYYYLGADENLIASPGANIEDEVFEKYDAKYQFAQWNTKNTVRYKSANLTKNEFESIETDSALLALYGTSDGKRKAKNLKIGDTHSFKTENGKVGVFRVYDISGTDAGEVKISIKLQK